MLPKLLTLVVVLVASLLIRIHKSQASLAKPGCQEKCGNVTIPYPFGIGTGCYLYKSFEVSCDGSSQDQYPLRFANIQRFPILEFSTNLVRVIDESTIKCNNDWNMSIGEDNLDQYLYFSQENLYVTLGCNILVVFSDVGVGRGSSFECESLCNETTPAIFVTTCNGFNGCCKRSVPENTTSFGFIINYNTLNSCAHALIAENSAPVSFGQSLLQLPMVLNWVVASTTCHQATQTGDSLCGRNSFCVDSVNGPGYNCHCKQGYKGNPYLPEGCRDVNSCPKQSNHYCEEGETCVYTHGSYKCISPHSHKSNVPVALEIVIGLSAFGVMGYWTYKRLVKIRKNKIKKKFFEKNGGHLLLQQISADKSCVTTIKVYSVEEMEKATKNFSRSRIVGKGGQGTIYKGLFSDGTVAAVKKSHVINADQVERFASEVFILAQINHRNIVKLLGCCLEYEVPILVYEYLANDTLSQHLHVGTRLLTLSWKVRIHIAMEVAGALAYLHSYASPAIFHRDIKPSNILLDQNFKAVVSDFGLSRLVPLSKSHLTTQVEGTFGYLDPEYFQSGKLTSKSDVYSFGVVLTELLTRKSSISSSESGEGLVPRFKYLVKHNRFVEILDKQVVQEATMDDLFLVVTLAKRCLKTNGKKRPSMEDVVANLNKLRVVQHALSHKCIIEHKLTTSEL